MALITCFFFYFQKIIKFTKEKVSAKITNSETDNTHRDR